MPFTFFAHQVPVLPLKTWRPRWFDGTALVISSMAPDLAYAFGPTVLHGHHLDGLFTICVPMTLTVTFVVRRFVADVAFAYLDHPRFQLADFRALATRRPPVWQTVISAVLGAGSHILLDSFTHDFGWGARVLGWNHPVIFHLLGRDFTVARTLQYVGHTFGSITCVVMLWLLTRRGRMADWYGTHVIQAARSCHVTRRQRLAFWTVTLMFGMLSSAATIGQGATIRSLFVIIWGLGVGVFVASLLPICRPRSDALVLVHPQAGSIS